MRQLVPDGPEPEIVTSSWPAVATAAPLPEGGLVTVAYATRGPNSVDVEAEIDGMSKVAEIPALHDVDATWEIVRTHQGFWFSRTGSDDSGAAAWFVVDGNLHRVALDRPPRFRLGWLPLRGEPARGLLLSVQNEQPSLHIDEVTQSGMRSLGSVPWWQTAIQFETLASNRWSANVLENGLFAVVAYDGPPASRRLVLRIIGGDDPLEQEIPCQEIIDEPVRTVRGADDHLAVAARTASGELVAMIVDVNQPSTTRCRVLSLPSERVARSPVLYGSVDVLWTGDRFLVAWLREDGVVRAAELTSRNARPVVVNIASGADLHDPLRQMLAIDGETVSFTWRTTSGQIATRRVPKAVTTYALGLEVRNWFTRILEQGSSSRKP